MNTLSDEQWLAANLDPHTYREKSKIDIPGLPPSDVQVRFTGMHGNANLRQAFDFYKFALQHMPTASVGRYRLVDFGGGWGRVTRFFLREVDADRLLLLDCLSDAVECARSLKPPFNVVHTNAQPPLPLEMASADCCIAFSVFSHLSEKACIGWIQHLGELLVPGGTLIFTTRGKWQIERLRLHKRLGFIYKLLRRGNVHEQVTSHASLDQIEQRYDDGLFQFFPTGGGGELTEDFYGETWIPEQWMREKYSSLGFRRCEFFQEQSSITQCTFVLTK
ncbi:methyltransferase [Rhodanobacter panaciterrae]|uniref:Methyltransferase n=1 Tax=Rhodanobacter panaciterrae TaxID=490572 RepID=A0ABQ2ZGV7_9GAMM|nr:class I SAM-dependent methyltransferase [Rhodanobacter panaciterrae]GGY15873.1 methyltransferase [Rhodanobacter panaciterrae]